MKTKAFGLLLPLLSLAVVGHADVIFPGSCKSISKTIDESVCFQYHNRIAVFFPNHQTYERIKNNALYGGVEAFYVPVLNKDHDNMLLDAEVRMGYNFFLNGKDHITPFGGIGYVQDFFHQDHRTVHRPGVVYGTAGFLYMHEFRSFFELGLNAKFILGGPISHNHRHWGSPVVGMDAALPITFRFGHHKHWDFRIEPFDMFLRGSRLFQNYFGFRSTVGYRF